MKNLNLMKTLTILSAALLLQTFTASSAHAAACTALTTGTDVPALVDGERACTLSPSSLIFKIYELSICKSAVSPSTSAADKAAKCTTLFESSTGKDVDLTPGSVFQLKDGLSLDEGTYDHGLLKMHVTQTMKTQFTFPVARATVATSGNNAGRFCYSNESNISNQPTGTNSQIDCHASAYATKANTSTINIFGEEDSGSNFQMNQAIQVPNVLNGVTAKTNLYVLDSDGTQSTGDFNYAADPKLSAGNDRKFILADQTLASAVVISPDTTALDIQFSVTGSSSIAFKADGDIFENTFNGLIFLFSAK